MILYAAVPPRHTCLWQNCRSRIVTNHSTSLERKFCHHSGMNSRKLSQCWIALNDSTLNLFLQTKVILEIGPLLPEAQFCDEEAGDHIIKETTHENTHVYFGSTFRSHHLSYSFHFGSAATLSAPQILDLAAGLEASNQLFLWILCSPNAPMVTHDLAGALPPLEFLPPGISTGSLYYPFWNQRPYNP